MSLRREPAEKWWQRVAEFFGMRERRYVSCLTWLDDSPVYKGGVEEACASCALGQPHTVRLHKYDLRKREILRKSFDFSDPRREFYAQQLFYMGQAEREMRTEELALPWFLR